MLFISSVLPGFQGGYKVTAGQNGVEQRHIYNKGRDAKVFVTFWTFTGPNEESVLFIKGSL
jgi:carboxypeptidase C (cathepsin A)